MGNVVSRVLGFLRAGYPFLRAGYPAGVPATGYVPVLALLPRRVSDEEVAAITELIVDRGEPVGAADVGVEITRVTNEMPSFDDIGRVRDRLAGTGRPEGATG